MESSTSTPRIEGSGRRLPQVPCKQCRRRHSNPRSKPYERVNGTCDRQPAEPWNRTCGKCYLRMQQDEIGCWSCPDPLCRGTFSWQPALQISSLRDQNVPESSAATDILRPMVLRTDCRNCRRKNTKCSGLSTGPRCDRCEYLDMDCDCKVLRTCCAECMKTRREANWKRCAGFRDACDSCIEKGIECRKFVREPMKEDAEEKQPQDTFADGIMDVVDGMKAVRAFAACERCLEEKLKCDESLPGCGGCGEKGVECKYRLLTTTISDFSAERPNYRRPPFSRLNQEVAEENTQREVPPRRARIPVACTTCRKSKLRCSGILPTFEACEQCHELGLGCVPKHKSAERPSIFEKWQRIGPEKEVEQLESMMSDLELEGWHFVSHEEAEDYELLKSGSI